jgi:hypothetical protein
MQVCAELIVVEGAELGTELHIEVAFGERSLYGGHRGVFLLWEVESQRAESGSEAVMMMVSCS